MTPHLASGNRKSLAGYAPQHFLWQQMRVSSNPESLAITARLVSIIIDPHLT